MKRGKRTAPGAILFTCAGGSAPLYLADRLRKRYPVVLADAQALHAGRFTRLPCEVIPFGNHPSYAARLGALVRKHRITVLVPGADEEILPALALAKRMPGLAVVAPRRQFVEMCLDKKALMEALADAGISHLRPFRRLRDVTFPAIVKPVRGRGSREVHRVNSLSELKGYLALYGKRFADVLAQAYIAGDEYTVSVVVNDMNALIGVVPKRVLAKRGITRSAVTKKSRAIEEACRRIVERFEPRGPFNVQLKLYNGKPCIFEINPRLSTTAVLTERAFGNEVELFIRSLGNARPAQPKMKEGVTLVRYEENLFG